MHNDSTTYDNKTEDSISVEEKDCTEEEIKVYKVELEKLEGEIGYLWDIVETHSDLAENLEPYLHTANKMFAELLETEPCNDETFKKVDELWHLIEEVHIFAEAILVKIENTDSINEEEPDTAVKYYILEIGDEVYGKFEWMVVKIFEEDSRIVFEEGQVYDCFLEWIFNATEEVYEPMHGKILSVSWSDVETVEWYFEDATPFSWSGTDLDEFTDLPHPMDRLELSVLFVDEA
jgi:hypothetical protein